MRKAGRCVLSLEAQIDKVSGKVYFLVTDNCHFQGYFLRIPYTWAVINGSWKGLFVFDVLAVTEEYFKW